MEVEMGDAPAVMAPDAAAATSWGELAMPAAGGLASWAADVEEEHEASGRNSSVLEVERQKALKRAERFNIDFKAPTKRVIAGLSRKDLMQMRREEAEKKLRGDGGFATGIDLFDPEEERKRAARAAKYGEMLVALTPEQAAENQRLEAQAAEDKLKKDFERAEIQEILRKRREKFGLEDSEGVGGMDTEGGGGGATMSAGVDLLEERVDPEADAVWRSDAVHLYGVDIMTTGECSGYFAEYGPVFVEWINDSSCNVVFADEHSARRAIRMKGTAMGAEANPDEKGALMEGSDPEMQWHAGPGFEKSGKISALSFRLATEDDIKPHGKIRSRYLWLSQKEKQQQQQRRKRNAGGNGGGGGGGEQAGGKRKRRGGGGGERMRGFDDEDEDGGDGGVDDLRARLRQRKQLEEDMADAAAEASAGGGGDDAAAIEGVIADATAAAAAAGAGEAMEGMEGAGADAATAAASVAAVAVAVPVIEQEPAPDVADLPETDLRKKLARGGPAVPDYGEDI